MIFKSTTLPVGLVLLSIPFLPANSQNVQNWATNDSVQVERDAANGLINQQQANNLEYQNAKIQQETLKDEQRNGGFLTPQQQQKIGSQLRNLNHQTRNDMREDHPNGYPPAMTQQQWQNQGRWNQAYPNQYPNQYPYPNPYSQLPPGQQPPPGYYRHRQEYYPNGQPIPQ